MGVFFRIAFRNLVQAKRRSIILGLAVSMVTLLLVFLLSLSQGLSETLLFQATTLSAGHVNLAGFYKARPSDEAPMITEVPKLKSIVEKSVPNLAYQIDRVRAWGKIVSETSSIMLPLFGVDITEEKELLKVLRLAEEREYKEGGRAETFGDPMKLAEPGHILLFAAQAKRLGVVVGDPVTLTVDTVEGYANAAEFTVAAIAKDMGFMSNWTMFIDKKILLELYDMADDTSGQIMIYLDDIDTSTAVMSDLRKAFEAEGYQIMDYQPEPFWAKFEMVRNEDWIGQKLDFTTWYDEVSYFQWVLAAFDSITFILLVILTFIIGIGIMNTMWISVRERTREVGTIRAIGMSRFKVLFIFVLEAAMLGLFATTIGGVAGAALSYAIDAMQLNLASDAVRMLLMSDTLHLVVKFKHIALAVIAFTFITALSGFLPALRASRMQPVKAIQHVG